MALEDSLTITSVCNIALAHIGQSPITDVTDETDISPEAKACRRYYSICRKDVFREHSWGFATAQVALVENEDLDSDDYPEWSYFYTYPASALTLWAVFNSDTVLDKWKNEFEVVYNPTLLERVVLTNQEEAIAECTYDVTDVTIWDHKFLMAFTYRLAAMIVQIIAGDMAKSQAMMELSNAYISEAKRVGHYEKKKKPEQDNPYVDAR
jgi:hypothetical protein